jgi:hypothetical protein
MKTNVNGTLTGRRTRDAVTVVKPDRNEHGAESRDGVQN